MRRILTVLAAALLLLAFMPAQPLQAESCARCTITFYCVVDECWVLEWCNSLSSKPRWTCEITPTGCSMAGEFCFWT